MTDWRHTRWVAERLAEVVDAEGPILKDEAIRRAYDSWAVARVGSKMREAVVDELSLLPLERRPRLVADVFWPAQLDAAAWTLFRVSRPDDPDIRAVEAIPLAEIKNAVLAVLARALAIDEDQLVGQLMQIFGITRRGAKVSDQFKEGIRVAVQTGRAAQDGSTVRFVEVQ